MDLIDESQFQTFFDWKKVLLKTRCLAKPDGRPLYQYRIREAEFLHLENFLRDKIRELNPHYDLVYITDRLGFADLFVLYGAEWWRRKYDGHGFMWEPILSDLEMDSSEWTPSHRSKCVQNGLRSWNLDLLKTGGHRFLGAVAIQGGLPMRLLSEARGRVSHVLSRILQLSKNSSVSRQDLHNWVISLQNILPIVYRQSEIFDLLADIAWTVLELKQKANLTSGTDAIARLDEMIPMWREEFPLPIEDNEARALLEQLVREAATVRPEKRTLIFPLIRSLAPDGESEWIIRSNIDLPDSVAASDLSRVFDISAEDLPRTADLSLVVGETARNAQIRKMAGHDEYRIARTPWGFSGLEVTSEHILRLNAADGRVWSATATKGQPMDEDLPWVFSSDDMSRTLLRQGNGGVNSTEALLAIPENWTVAAQEDSEFVEYGKLKSPRRRLYRFRGIIVAQDSNGNLYRFRTGQAGTTEITYDWRGFRYWLDFQNPTIAFRGIPDLYEIDEDGNKRKSVGDVECTVIGSAASRTQLGPVHLRYPAKGEIKHRTRMILLPEEARVILITRDANSGSITFSDWGISKARVLTPNVMATESIDGANCRLHLSVSPSFRTPDRIEIELLWSHTTTSSRITLPFPAKGIRAFDPLGRELHSGERIALQQILGVRFLILGGQSNAPATLTLKSSNGKATRKYRILPAAGAISFEIRISDYLSDIQHLMSIDDSPDAVVQVIIDLGNERSFLLEVSRYAAKIERGNSSVLINKSDIDDLSEETFNKIIVQAIKLEAPGEDPVTLLRVNSEEDSQLRWDFSPSTREPGSWLLYPPIDAPLNFRPTLWHIRGDVEETNAIAQAISIANQDERNASLDILIENLSADYRNSSWVEVEQLSNQIGHLPLATLDIWRRFARSASGMSALLCRVGNLREGFVRRFSQELPFAWETVAFSAWKKSMELTKQQCNALFGVENGKSMMKLLLNSKIKDLSAEHPALAFVLGIAGSECIPENLQMVAGLRVISDQGVKRLFDGENSHLMNLRRNHADDIWPEEFKSILSNAKSQPTFQKFLFSDEFKARNCVINLPLLLAAQVATGQTEQWLGDPGRVQMLRTYRAFDPDWFDEAYNITITRCLADGLLDS